jgi:hypothetical protein
MKKILCIIGCLTVAMGAVTRVPMEQLAYKDTSMMTATSAAEDDDSVVSDDVSDVSSSSHTTGIDYGF